MHLSYVLELLPPTKNKKHILLNNIKSVQQNRKKIAEKLSQGISNLSTKNFKHILLPSAVINQNIREVKVLYKNFKKSDSPKETLSFKNNQPLCYNNQNYRLDLENGFVSIRSTT